MFIHRCSYKIAALVSWHTTPVSLCQSNDLQLEIQIRRCYLKNVALDFVFGFDPMLHPSCYLTSIMDIKLTMDQLFLFFLCNFSSFLSYVRGIPVTNHFPLLLIDRQLYFGYSANYNTQGAFAILILICSDLPNFLRSLERLGHNNRKWLKQPKSHFY